YFRESLEIRQKLYPAAKFPDGHPDLATGLNNMGYVLEAVGQTELALKYHRQSLDMTRRLYPATRYPDGHPILVQSLNNLGTLSQARINSQQPLVYPRQSLKMQQQLVRRELAAASEEAALDRINAEPLMRDDYLSVTRAVRTPAADVARDIWQSRAMVTRLLEQ